MLLRVLHVESEARNSKVTENGGQLEKVMTRSRIRMAWDDLGRLRLFDIHVFYARPSNDIAIVVCGGMQGKSSQIPLSVFGY